MLENNLKLIFEQIKNGNNLGEPITLVGASKTVSAEVINRAVQLGLKVVAENRVQEFREKNQLLVGVEQQFIGHLQTNKIKYLVGKVSLIHSVDSIHLAQAIDVECAKKGVIQNVLIEINVGGELSKSGFELDNASLAIEDITKNCKNIRIKGLMAMLPHTEDQTLLTDLCIKMRALYDNLKNKGYDFEHLSLGMSADYKIAIKNGSNMIRLGSSIFGQRNYGEIK